jgi:hypothetical protein
VVRQQPFDVAGTAGVTHGHDPFVEQRDQGATRAELALPRQVRELGDGAASVDERQQRPPVGRQRHLGAFALRPGDRHDRVPVAGAFLDRRPGLEPRGRLGQHLVDRDGEVEDLPVAGLGVPAVEPEVAVLPPQQVEDGVHGLFADHLGEGAGLDGAGAGELAGELEVGGQPVAATEDLGEVVRGHQARAEEPARDGEPVGVAGGFAHPPVGEVDPAGGAVTGQRQPPGLRGERQQPEDLREGEVVEVAFEHVSLSDGPGVGRRGREVGTVTVEVVAFVGGRRVLPDEVERGGRRLPHRRGRVGLVGGHRCRVRRRRCGRGLVGGLGLVRGGAGA